MNRSRYLDESAKGSGIKSMSNRQLESANELHRLIMQKFRKRRVYSSFKDNFKDSSEFYNSSFKTWLEENDIKMYSTYDKEKSVVAKKFIRTLKHNLQTQDSRVKNVYFDVLDAIVDKCNDTYHITIKIRPVDVKSNFLC